jgi:hypothetical protein
LRPTEGGSEALDDLDYVIDEMTQILRFYEAAAERGIQLPYPGSDRLDSAWHVRVLGARAATTFRSELTAANESAS